MFDLCTFESYSSCYAQKVQCTTFKSRFSFHFQESFNFLPLNIHIFITCFFVVVFFNSQSLCDLAPKSWRSSSNLLHIFYQTLGNIHSIIAMYPKVKVKVRKEEEDAEQYALELSSLQSLKGFENLSPYDSSPDESPTSIVRIPGSFVSGSPTAKAPVPKGTTNNDKQTGSRESKTNIRASSVPRPCAVLSSPDNDAMIGSKNKAREELLSGLKNHNPCHNRHAQCKVIPRLMAAPSPGNTRKESKGAGDSKNDLQTKGRSIVDDPSKRTGHRKGKAESFRSKTSGVRAMNK